MKHKTSSRIPPGKHKRNKSQILRNFPVWVWFLIGIILLAVPGAFVLQNFSTVTVAYPSEISVAQALTKQKNGALILDVREPEEWVNGHISGAVNIPLGQLPEHLNEIPSNREIVVICRTGVRSAQGRDILQSAGYKKVTSVTGGIVQWQAQGQPLITGQ